MRFVLTESVGRKTEHLDLTAERSFLFLSLLSLSFSSLFQTSNLRNNKNK